MKLKVTNRWNLNFTNHTFGSSYNIRLDRDPPYITEEDIERLVSDPKFQKWKNEKGYEPLLGKRPFMKYPLLAVTDKNGKNVFTIDFYGSKVTHHKDYERDANQIMQWLVQASLREAAELYANNSIKESLPNYFD